MIDLKKLEEAVAKGEVSRRKHDTLPLSIYTYSKLTEINKNWNPITRVCRGLILEDGTGKVIGNPFPKFFNIEEQAEDRRLEGNLIIKYKGTDIRLPTCDYTVFDKMDGSIIYVASYKDQLVVSSKGSFNSAQARKAKAMLENKYKVQPGSGGYTYIMEAIYPENRIVVDYGNLEELCLLGIRDNSKNEDLSVEKADKYAAAFGFSRPTRYDKKIEELLTEKDNPFDNREGYVIHFENGEKLKIKFTAYFDLHKIMTEVTSKDILEAMMNGTSIAEFCATKDIPDEMLQDIIRMENSYKEAFTIYEMEGAKLYEDSKSSNDKDTAMKIGGSSHIAVVKSVAFAIMRNKDYADIIWKYLKEKEKDNRQYIGKAGEMS